MALVRISIDLDDEMAAALDQMIAAMDLQCSHELAAAAGLRDWPIAAAYLPSDEIEEDTLTEGEA